MARSASLQLSRCRSQSSAMRSVWQDELTIERGGPRGACLFAAERRVRAVAVVVVGWVEAGPSMEGRLLDRERDDRKRGLSFVH